MLQLAFFQNSSPRANLTPEPWTIATADRRQVSTPLIQLLLNAHHGNLVALHIARPRLKRGRMDHDGRKTTRT